MTTGRVQYARCWGCIHGQCYGPTPEPHTWMDDEDAAAKGLSWPLTAEQEAAHPCACLCAGGPGACVDIEATP